MNDARPGPSSTRVVALDGPAGSGKSTVARRVAEALAWRFVDTGATYRAVTLAALRSGTPLDDAEALTALAEQVDVVLGSKEGEPAVLLDGEDVSDAVRGPEVTAAVSAVSAVPGVRRAMVALQRLAIGEGEAVVEGRDISTVVAPDAGVKVFLDARPEVRAQRRAGDQHAGVEQHEDPEELRRRVLEALTSRDAMDAKTNALVAADGAAHLDTSDLSLDEVVGVIVSWVTERGLLETR